MVYDRNADGVFFAVSFREERALSKKALSKDAKPKFLAEDLLALVQRPRRAVSSAINPSFLYWPFQARALPCAGKPGGRKTELPGITM